VAAFHVAQDGAAGAAKQDCVAGGVDDHVESLVCLEAEGQGDGGVAEVVDVQEFKGEGATGRVGGGDAEVQAAEGGGHVVAEGIASVGGL